MIVLFIAPLPPPLTGHSLASQVLVDELRKHHHVEIVNFSKGGFKHGVDSVSRVIQVLRVLAAVWRLKRSADVVYLTVSESLAGNLKDLLIYLICFSKLRRTVIHLHGGAGLRHIMLGRKRLQRRMNEFFIKRLGGAIVLGRRHADVFAEALTPERVHIVPNFAQDYLFADTATVDRKFRDPKPLRIAYVSNLIPGKGYLELIEAFLALDASLRASLALDLAGDFESTDQKQACLERIAGAPQIAYHGVVTGERKKELFQRAHLFCLPTYFPYEGQPISILEAYAAGCAVITTDHSGIGDVFTDGVNGYQVSKQSVGSIKDAIERAAGEPARLRAVALRNLEHARQQYRTDLYNSRVMRILEGVGRENGRTTTVESAVR